MARSTWEAHAEELTGPQGRRLWLARTGSAGSGSARSGASAAGIATWGEVAQAWQADGAFRALFTELLARVPYDAFTFETPPVSRDRLGRRFEAVLYPAPFLAGEPADGTPFRAHFDAAPPGAQVVAFPNLGRDATLIVPCPIVRGESYAHIASFCRDAPRVQCDALWREVGETLMRELGERPTWVSTAGGGVFWLHFRLDSRPKYVRHRPYREWP